MTVDTAQLEMIRVAARKLADRFGDEYWLDADRNKKSVALIGFF